MLKTLKLKGDHGHLSHARRILAALGVEEHLKHTIVDDTKVIMELAVTSYTTKQNVVDATVYTVVLPGETKPRLKIMTGGPFKGSLFMIVTEDVHTYN